MSDLSLSLVKETIKKNLDVELSIDNSGGSLRTRRGLQHMMFLKFSQKDHQIYLESIMTLALKAEKLSPLGGIEFLNLFCGKRPSVKTRVTRKKDAVELLKSRNYDKIVEFLLLECLELCNTNTRLVLKKSSNEKSCLEMTEGFTFNAASLLKNDIVELRNVKTACIDGYIESISEIHHLLTSLSESKIPCLMFARGMSDDVLHTLKVNNERKTLLVYPFSIPFDIDNVNSIVDIAVLSDTDLVSSTKGDLISSLNPSRLGSIESCTIKNGTVSIKNKYNNRTKNHIDNLKKSIEDRQDIAEVLSKRLRSLSTSCLEISIPDDIEFYSKSQQLDEGIRIVSSIVNNTYDPLGAANIVYDSYKASLANSEVFYFD